MKTPYAYIAQGDLHFLDDNGKTSIVESQFGKSLTERSIALFQKNSWKREGSGAKFMSGGMLWEAGRQQDPSETEICLTGLTRGSLEGEWFYTLDTGSISGLFRVQDDQPERRLYCLFEWRTRIQIGKGWQSNSACAWRIHRTDCGGRCDSVSGRVATRPRAGRQIVRVALSAS